MIPFILSAIVALSCFTAGYFGGYAPLGPDPDANATLALGSVVFLALILVVAMYRGTYLKGWPDVAPVSALAAIAGFSLVLLVQVASMLGSGHPLFVPEGLRMTTAYFGTKLVLFSFLVTSILLRRLGAPQLPSRA